MLGHRGLLARDFPNPIKRNPSLTPEALNLGNLREIRKRVSANCRTDDPAVERERGTHHRQAMKLRYENGGAFLGLGDTTMRAFGKNTGVVSGFLEQLEQWRRVDWAEN